MKSIRKKRVSNESDLDKKERYSKVAKCMRRHRDKIDIYAREKV